MPVRNEQDFVESTLKELLRQDYPSDRYEIIVADGESTDRTGEIVEEIACTYRRVILMHNPRRFSSSGRNVGFKNGKGDLFLVIDGHCRIDNDQLLRNVVECFEKSNAQCLARPQSLIIPDEPTMQRAIGLARTSWLGHSSKSDIYSSREGFVSPVTAGCAYKREVFEKIGYVDESFSACEDVEFNYRVEKAGFLTFFSPLIGVKYYPRESLSGLWKQLLRYGRGRFQYIFKHPATMNGDMMLPAALVLGIGIGPLLGFVHVYFLWVYLAILALYFGVVAVESMHLGKGNGLGFILKLMVTFFLIHTTLGIGLIKGAIQTFLIIFSKIGHKTKKRDQCLTEKP